MTTPTQILNAELALSDIIYDNNTSLHPGGVVSTLLGWSIIRSQIIDAHGFFAEAFKSDTENTIIIAFQGSILKPSVDDVSDKYSFKTEWAAASRDADWAILKTNDNKHPSAPPNAFDDALAFTKEVLNANPDATIYLTGHSLGGAEAEWVASHLAVDPLYANRIIRGDTFAAPGIYKSGTDIPLTDFTNFVEYGDPAANFGGHYGQVQKIGNQELQAATAQIEASADFLMNHRNFGNLDSFFVQLDVVNHLNYIVIKQPHLPDETSIIRAVQHDAFAALIANHTLPTYTTDIHNLQPPPPHAGESLLFENFDKLGQILPLPVVANLANDGWFNVNNGGKTTTVLQPDGAQGPLDFFLNTRDTDGFDLLIGHSFKDPTGGQALVSFDFKTQPGMNLNDILQVNLDDIQDSNFAAKVGSYPAANLPSGWQHADIVINTGAPDSTHTLYIWDRGLIVTPTGFGVDNIQVHDWII